MKKLCILSVLCLILTACGGKPPASAEEPVDAPPAETLPESGGVIFSYGGKDCDLQKREPNVNALMGETQVGTSLVVEGHISPQIAYYGIFDTETETFVKDILGTNLTWRDDDITTAVYDVWSDSCIYGYDSQLLARLDLEESQYVYGLTWTDSSHLSVEIADSNSDDPPMVLDLEIPVT